jgi:hypothetical protein
MGIERPQLQDLAPGSHALHGNPPGLRRRQWQYLQLDAPATIPAFPCATWERETGEAAERTE